MKHYALIVDDDRSDRRLVSGVMRNQLHLSPVEAENGQAALDVLKKTDAIKIIILDLDMPVMNGRVALKTIQSIYPRVPVIVLTGSNNTKDAVEAMKCGALDFLTKPLEPERLIVSVRNGLKISLMSNEISRLKRKNKGRMCFSDLIGHDKGLSHSVEIARKAAASHLPVLITGETGTGKEMFARSIHGESDRGGNSFIALNCGAIPENLVESTLFGHEKGAFTGATEKALGKFQEANTGTIFLDEVGELPIDAQVKLLRVLQQKEVQPVGAGKPVQVDVRVISATNRHLLEDVKAGRFREDLYFRLNVLNISVPPLSERQNDIEALADYFIERYCASHHCSPKLLSSGAMDKLKSYQWPGNVRELENIINRAMTMSDGPTIIADDIIPSMPQEASDVSASSAHSTEMLALLNQHGRFRSFKDIEDDIVMRALQHHDHNVAKTARVLGIAKSTLYAKMNHAADKQSA